MTIQAVQKVIFKRKENKKETNPVFPTAGAITGAAVGGVIIGKANRCE